jgi:hypothetical protein
MPLSSREAYGLFQSVVAKIGNEAEMLRVGLAGYGQALQENDQLQEKVKQLEEKFGVAKPPSDPPLPFPPRG